MHLPGNIRLSPQVSGIWFAVGCEPRNLEPARWKVLTGERISGTADSGLILDLILSSSSFQISKHGLKSLS